MIVAMAHDYRVILIKLADRLHNMRTIRYLAKQKQLNKAKETVEIYAPIAHRLGVHSIKWELEDLSFAVLYPRKYADIQQMVQTRKSDRERLMRQSNDELQAALQEVGIVADISGRTKHFYSIFQKMQRKGKEFNEIYDLTGIRVRREQAERLLRRDRHHPLDLDTAAGALQGLHRHPEDERLPVAAHDGDRALRQAARDPGPHRGHAPHRRVRHRGARPLQGQGKTGRKAQAAASRKAEDWIKNLMEWESPGRAAPHDFMEGLRFDLYDDEVYVFTPKGQVKSLAAGATPLDFAYSVHTDVGHRCVGAKVNGRIVPLSYTLQSGDTVEVLTSNQLDKGPSRDWVNIVQTNRARSKIRHFFAKERREDYEQRGRDSLADALKRQSIPHAKIAQSSLLASVIREMRLQEGGGVLRRARRGQVRTERRRRARSCSSSRPTRRCPTTHRSWGCRTHEAPADPLGRRLRGARRGDRGRVGRRGAHGEVLHAGAGRPDQGLHLARSRDHDPPRRLPQRASALEKNPERFTPVHWEGRPDAAFRAEMQIEAWDRVRLLEEISRTISEHGCNIVQHQGVVDDQMVKERFTVELGDVTVLKSAALGAAQHRLDLRRLPGHARSGLIAGPETNALHHSKHG